MSLESVNPLGGPETFRRRDLRGAAFDAIGSLEPAQPAVENCFTLLTPKAFVDGTTASLRSSSLISRSGCRISSVCSELGTLRKRLRLLRRCASASLAFLMASAWTHNPNTMAFTPQKSSQNQVNQLALVSRMLQNTQGQPIWNNGMSHIRNIMRLLSITAHSLQSVKLLHDL